MAPPRAGGRWERLGLRVRPAVDRSDPDTGDPLDEATVSALRQRLGEMLTVLGADPPPVETPDLERSHDLDDLLDAAAGALTPLDAARAWLLLAAVTGRLPLLSDVRALVRHAALEGPRAALDATVETTVEAWAAEESDGDAYVRVSVVDRAVLVDLHHTVGAAFATGIQRVTREVSRRWTQSADPVLVGWRTDLTAMRLLSPDEQHRALHGGPPVDAPEVDTVVVPWRSTYILPELAAEVARADRVLAMAACSATTLNMIGYDLVPVTTAETSHIGLVPGFARNLAAARYARVVAPISAAAGDEYRGWTQMLAGTGFDGPRIQPVLLPAEVPAADPQQTERAARRLLVGTLPLVLVVGSHEPRKNHLTVLHAAELLWREGHRFSLTFVGGNSWNSDAFQATLAGLAAAGRPVESISAVSDDLLWGGYRVARFTVFPSLNEGFGLPLAESLACGTPAVTSDFGSMREIVEGGGGAILVDPRADHSVADGMRSLLTDDDLLRSLREQALARPERTWDMYARQTWELFTTP
jgi:glycosyltransferase involved in cell wall biosynthesis